MSAMAGGPPPPTPPGWAAGGSRGEKKKQKKKRTPVRREDMDRATLENMRLKDKERKRVRRLQMTEDERERGRCKDKTRKAIKRRQERIAEAAAMQTERLPGISAILAGTYPGTAGPQVISPPAPKVPGIPPPHKLPHPPLGKASTYKHPVQR